MTEPNKYSGRCFRCGKRVEAGEGVIREWDRKLGEVWFPPPLQPVTSFLVEHKECHQKFEGTAVHFAWLPQA